MTDSTTSDSGPTPLPAALGEHWGLLVGYGVVCLGLGLALAVWPGETLVVCAVIIAIQLLVASLRSNLVALESLVGQRLETRKRLAGLLQRVFQANQEAERLFAPWLQIMEMQINRSLDDARKGNPAPGAAAGRDLAASIALDRSAQAAQRGFSAVIDQLVQMQRSGFSSAVLREGADPAAAQRQFDRYASFYQGDAVQPAPHFAAAGQA